MDPLAALAWLANDPGRFALDYRVPGDGLKSTADIMTHLQFDRVLDV
jgi:hypothetical protein